MEKLSKLKCRACEGLEDKLKKNKIDEYLSTLNKWEIKSGKLHKEFKFKDFSQSLEFVNKVGKIAEEEGHHPDIEMGWGYVRINLTTHALKGLSINDFILAAKIDNV